MSKPLIIKLLILSVPAFAASGCTPGGGGAAQPIPLGLMEIDVSALEPGLDLRGDGAGSYYGTFSLDGVVLGIAVAEGPCKPIEGLVPGTCADGGGDDGHEIDSMVTDHNGVPLAIAMGGDDFVEPSWSENVALGEIFLPDATQRGREFEAMEALDGQLPSTAGVRIDITGIANAVHDLDIGEVTARDHDPDPFDSAGLPVAAPPPAVSYYHEIHQYKGACCGVAEHSATLTFVYDSSWSPLSYVKRGNHGRYHSEAGMSWYCSYTSGLRSNSSPYVTAYDSTDTYGATPGGGCNTSYGLAPGKHVCSDDSHAEIKNVKKNAYSSASVCSDILPNGNADACSSI